jgi:hypothetical protein
VAFWCINSKVKNMKIKEILNYLQEDSSNWHKANDYIRFWSKEKNKWIYKHREKLGVIDNPNLVVHHKDGNIHNNCAKNLEAISRAEHAKIGKPALKWKHCIIKNCKEKHFSKGYCRKHYWEKFNK